MENLKDKQAVANLDPLIQPLNDQYEQPVHYNHTNSCLSYVERFSGIIYAIIASLLFTCSNFIMKQLDVILLDVFLIRFFFQGLISIGYLVYKGYSPFSTNSHGLLILFRSLIAASASILFYIGLSLLQLTDLITIRYTQVVWTIVLASIIFRERMNLPTVLACILTVVGVVCVAEPTFLFSQTRTTNETLSKSSIESNGTRLFGMFIALLCAISISLAIILTKKLLERKIRQSLIMFYFILTIFILLLIKQTHFWTLSTSNQLKFDLNKIYFTKNFLYATLLATLQLIPMVLTQKAIKREHPSIISVVQSSDILFSIVLQNLFSQQKSNRFTLLGSSLVLTSILIVGGYKIWKDRREHLLKSEIK